MHVTLASVVGWSGSGRARARFLQDERVAEAEEGCRGGSRGEEPVAPASDGRIRTTVHRAEALFSRVEARLHLRLFGVEDQDQERVGDELQGPVQDFA